MSLIRRNLPPVRREQVAPEAGVTGNPIARVPRRAGAVSIACHEMISRSTDMMLTSSLSMLE
jgi:hypothetical protein